MPTKIYRIKMNDFWINVSYSPPHYPRQKTKKSNVPKNLINAFKSQQVQFQNHRTCSLSTVQTFEHFNSYSFKFNSGVRNKSCSQYVCFTANLLWTDPAIEFEWIAIEMSESLCGGKGAVSVILKLDLWFEGIYLIFGTFNFFVFLTCVMRRTVANINPKIIHFDAVDFSGHHSKKL